MYIISACPWFRAGVIFGWTHQNGIAGKIGTNTGGTPRGILITRIMTPMSINRGVRSALDIQECGDGVGTRVFHPQGLEIELGRHSRLLSLKIDDDFESGRGEEETKHLSAMDGIRWESVALLLTA